MLARRLHASHGELWELARRDELTGVGNDRGLHERLAAEISRHQRHSREFALILLDLDGFKRSTRASATSRATGLLAEIGPALSKRSAARTRSSAKAATSSP